MNSQNVFDAEVESAFAGRPGDLVRIRVERDKSDLLFFIENLTNRSVDPTKIVVDKVVKNGTHIVLTEAIDDNSSVTHHFDVVKFPKNWDDLVSNS